MLTNSNSQEHSQITRLHGAILERGEILDFMVTMLSLTAHIILETSSSSRLVFTQIMDECIHKIIFNQTELLSNTDVCCLVTTKCTWIHSKVGNKGLGHILLKIHIKFILIASPETVHKPRKIPWKMEFAFFNSY